MTDDQRAAGRIHRDRAAEVPTDVARRWLAERDEARKLLAETRAAGDALAEVSDDTQVHDGPGAHRLMRAVDEWRSVRGDAPDDTSSEQE